VRVYTTKGLKEQGRFALYNAKRIVDFFSEASSWLIFFSYLLPFEANIQLQIFGIDYPLPKVDLLAVHEFVIMSYHFFIFLFFYFFIFLFFYFFIFLFFYFFIFLFFYFFIFLFFYFFIFIFYLGILLNWRLTDVTLLVPRRYGELGSYHLPNYCGPV